MLKAHKGQHRVQGDRDVYKRQGKSREDICSALREKFGEKNPEMQVLNR